MEITFLIVVVSLTGSGEAVPAEPRVKAYHTKLVKFPIPVTNTSHELGQESEAAPNCNLTITGPWSETFNLTAKPIPPRVDDILYVHIDIYAYTNIWFMRSKGNATRKGAAHGYSFDVNVCDYKLGFCPMTQGETKHVDWPLFLPSAYIDKGIYNGFAELLDQDGKSMVVVTVTDCPVV